MSADNKPPDKMERKINGGEHGEEQSAPHLFEPELVERLDAIARSDAVSIILSVLSVGHQNEDGQCHDAHRQTAPISKALTILTHIVSELLFCFGDSVQVLLATNCSPNQPLNGQNIVKLRVFSRSFSDFLQKVKGFSDGHFVQKYASIYTENDMDRKTKS